MVTALEIKSRKSIIKFNTTIPEPPPFPYHLRTLTEGENVPRHQKSLNEQIKNVKLKKVSVNGRRLSGKDQA